MPKKPKPEGSLKNVFDGIVAGRTDEQVARLWAGADEERSLEIAREIRVVLRPHACGWSVSEGDRSTGPLALDEALATFAAVLLDEDGERRGLASRMKTLDEHRAHRDRMCRPDESPRSQVTMVDPGPALRLVAEDLWVAAESELAMCGVPDRRRWALALARARFAGDEDAQEVLREAGLAAVRMVEIAVPIDADLERAVAAAWDVLEAEEEDVDD